MKLFFLLLMISTTIIFANNNIKHEILNKKILIGDLIEYKITIPVDSSSITLETKDFSPFELISKTQKFNDKNKSVEYTIKLSIYETGKQIIPQIIFSELRNKKENKITVPEKEIFINSVIKNIKDENLKIKDIKSTVSIKETNYLLIYILVGVLVIVIIYITLKKRKKKKKKEIIVIEKKLPAHEIAYKELSELINKDLIKTGKIKEYTFILSEIIRDFIGNRYDFDSIELTSGELLNHIKQEATFNRKYITIINNFLEDSDIIKFSKIEATNEEIEGLTKTAFKIVDDLKIKIMD